MRRLLPTIALVLVLAAWRPRACRRPNPPRTGDSRTAALTTVTPTCRVANDVADPLRRLIVHRLAGRRRGAPRGRSSFTAPLPGPPRIESCYRSFEMQEWWRDFYCFFGDCGFAAVPGTSVHGWGRAVDFEDGGGKLTFDSAGYQWLKANAARFGFVHPAWAEPGGSSPEPWHWEHA